ncbi:MAG TPA: GNAT family N-acetyltransferase [Thermomicrobiales bacterium]|nr:GNAT family N-acetyltransferase [Thermomicrobiales bacterium]
MNEQRDVSYDLEVLDRRHNRPDFSCGVESLDRYFRRFARQDMQRDLAVVYVLNDEGANRVAGYFTLCASSILSDELPASLADRLPSYGAFPAILLGRLAVDRDYQSRNVGRFLLVAAIRHTYRASRSIAAMAVTVDAIDESAGAFYRRFGFISYPSRPLSLFLPMSMAPDLIDGH